MNIDIEILFSRSPFVKKTKVDFGFIKPQKVDIIKLEKKHNEDKYSIAYSTNIASNGKNVRGFKGIALTFSYQ